MVRIANLHDAWSGGSAASSDERGAELVEAIRGFGVIAVVGESVAPLHRAAVCRDIVGVYTCIDASGVEHRLAGNTRDV